MYFELALTMIIPFWLCLCITINLIVHIQPNFLILFNADEFLNLDNNVLLFSGAIDEDIFTGLRSGYLELSERGSCLFSKRKQISP